MTQSRHVAVGVDVEAVRVGVAGEIEPAERHAFAIVRRGEQAVHLLLVGIGGFVGEEGGDLGGRGREAREIEAEAAQQRGAIGFG
jgi:hypothetical protein